MKTFVGIDPGKKGAIAVLNYTENGVDLKVLDCPVMKGKKDEYDGAGMAKILREAKESSAGQLHVFIESVHSMPGQGVSSTFDFGKGFGMWLGALAMAQIPYTLVSPVRWKKAMLPDMKAEKSASRLRAKQLFPTYEDQFALVKHDGRAEAVLMAVYGRRTLGGEVSLAQPTDTGTLEK